MDDFRRRGVKEIIIADVGASSHAELLRMHIVKFVQLPSLTTRGTSLEFCTTGFPSNLACVDPADDVLIPHYVLRSILGPMR
jgi:hypothetical protein